MRSADIPHTEGAPSAPHTEGAPSAPHTEGAPRATNIQGTPRADGPPARRTRRSRVSWLRTLPPLARHILASMPWVTLVSGCLVGTAFLALLAEQATPQSPLNHGDVHAAFLPAVAVLAFVLTAPFRPLTQACPVPAWVTPAGHLLLAAPVLAATCWAQLLIMGSTAPAHTLSPAPAVYPLIALLAGWCAVTVAIAACAQRSRYAGLGGAVAAPISFAVIALAWFVPGIGQWLDEPPAPPATLHGMTITWYVIVAVALFLAYAAMRDGWHRYTRGLQRLVSAVRGAA